MQGSQGKAVLFGTLFFCFALFGGCGESSSGSKATETKIHTLRVKKEAGQRHLYFSGVIKPLEVTNVSSSVEGEIKQRFFQYGDKIREKQLLFSIDSQELRKQFQDALSDFISTKETYISNQGKWRGQSELFKMGLVAKNDYMDSRRQREEATLKYYQSRQRLQQILESISEKGDKDFYDLNELSLDDPWSVNKALTSSKGFLMIRAPVEGIALFPQGEKSNQNQALLPGSPIKKGDILLSLGNLRGFSTEIKVSEVNISTLKVGQKASVTGAGFPGITLEGTVTNIDYQASSTNGTAPSFQAQIRIPAVDETLQNQIRIGMSIQIQLDLDTPKEIRIPFNALYTEKEGDFVHIIDPKTQAMIPTRVEVGDTGIDYVVITKGLQEGDEIVIPD